MKKIITIAAVLSTAPVYAQTPAATAPVSISGSITPAVQQIDNSTNSSKLTEYRDLEQKAFLPKITFGAFNPRNRWALDLTGTNVTRNDQTIAAALGQTGTWKAAVAWVETPHNFSNKAVTPYTQTAPGVLEVSSNVPITFKKLATGSAADVPGVLASDQLIADYQARSLASTALRTQTKAGHFAFGWSGSDVLSLGVAYDRRDKSGTTPAYGPIGDRPPRTLNIQLPEAVDYRTNDLTFAAEHQGTGYQIRAEYLFSDFANQIDTLRWENVFATAAPGATYDVWDRRVSTFGVRPLPPDNRYHNATVNAGVDTPRDGRLSASVAYGRMDQNQTLLPYSYMNDAIANPTLPRTTAQAQMNTVNLAAEYVIDLAARLHVRAFARRYDLENQTPESQWQYVTSDTTNLNGTVAYVNKRVNLPVAWNSRNAGAEATWRLPARSSLLFGYERENYNRDFREANTGENIFRVALRTRAAKAVSVQARYLQGNRDGGVYDALVTREGYWYTAGEASDFNNPQFSFDNHPDMRRFDVSDRVRRQVDVTVNLTPRSAVALSAFVRSRKDDFDSNVQPSQPLLGSGVADRAAATPGLQLGLLEDSRVRYGTDLFVQPTGRTTFNAFVNYDRGTSLQRGLEFNENNKQNPSAVATAELGPWTRGSNAWTADTDDATWSGGFGTSFQIVPDRVTLAADYTLSRATVDIAYAGYGVTNFDGTPFRPNQQFAFSSPPQVKEDTHLLNVRVEVPVRMVTFIAGYSYEKYTLNDWQQGSAAPWVEAVGADTLLRDSSRSYQWGNRLFNLGTYLAPGYTAHIGFFGFTYRF